MGSHAMVWPSCAVGFPGVRAAPTSLAGAKRQGNEKMLLIASFEKPRPLQTLPKAACANVCILVTSVTEPDAFRNPHKGRRASSRRATLLPLAGSSSTTKTTFLTPLMFGAQVRPRGPKIQRRASSQSCPSRCCGLQCAWVPARGRRCATRREDGVGHGTARPVSGRPCAGSLLPLSSSLLRVQSESFFQFASM